MMLRFALTATLIGAASLPAQFPGVKTFYTLTNDAADNEVQVGVSRFGQLFSVGRFSTGGTGTAAGLGSQGALATGGDGRYVVAVNPGSDDVTLFRTSNPLSLVRCDVAATGGTRPTSVDVHRDLVLRRNEEPGTVVSARQEKIPTDLIVIHEGTPDDPYPSSDVVCALDPPPSAEEPTDTDALATEEPPPRTP